MDIGAMRDGIPDDSSATNGTFAYGINDNGQIVGAMAGFGGSGAADNLNSVPLGADTSQQPFLTTPQHG